MEEKSPDTLRRGPNYTAGCPLPVTVTLEKLGHQLTGLCRAIRLGERCNTTFNGLLQRELGPVLEQGFLQAHGMRAGLQDSVGPLLDRAIEFGAWHHARHEAALQGLRRGQRGAR